MMRAAAWCATAAVLAAGLGVYAGILVGERDAVRSPVTVHVTPAEAEACGGLVNLNADVAIEAGEQVLLRLIRLDDEGHEHLTVVQVEEATAALDVGLPIPGTYSTSPDDPIEGRHLVRVERRDELLALGTVDVRACDAGS